jgi:hypothetical protein
MGRYDDAETMLEMFVEYYEEKLKGEKVEVGIIRDDKFEVAG